MPSTSSNNIIARCLLCKGSTKTIKGSKGITSNFVTYLKRLHPMNYKQYVEDKMQNNKEGASKNKHAQFLDNIIKFVVDAALPISVVENIYFRSLFQHTSFVTPNRRTFVGAIENKFDLLQKSLKKTLDEIPFVCMTADVWSCERRSFFGYTCHWLDNDLKRCSAALACQRFEGVHNYDKIADIINKINRTYGVASNKIIATVTDNGSNFIKAFKKYGIESNCSDEVTEMIFESILSGNEQRHRLSKHIRCASHLLNLITTKDLINLIKSDAGLFDMHKQAFSKCNNLWTKAGKPSSSEIIQKVLGSSLSYPVITRWNSTYDALLKIIRAEHKLNDLCDQLKIDEFIDDDILYLKNYVAVTKPFADALDFLQGENGIYYGCLIPTLVTILNNVRIVTTEERNNVLRNVLNSLKEKLIDRFHKYFTLSNEADEAIVASVLHPLCKLDWLDSLENLTSRSREQIFKMVVEYIVEANPGEQEKCENVEVQNSVRNSFFNFRKQSTNSESFRDPITVQCESELTRFLEHATFDSITSMKKLRLITNAFRKANTPLTSSAPVERLFSFAGIVNTPGRQAISDEHFQMLTLLKANINFV